MDTTALTELKTCNLCRCSLSSTEFRRCTACRSRAGRATQPTALRSNFVAAGERLPNILPVCSRCNEDGPDAEIIDAAGARLLVHVESCMRPGDRVG
jgi:hypothetical protein